MNKLKNKLSEILVKCLKKTVSLVLHLTYRVKVRDLNVPEHGRVILTANHVSFIDAILLGVKIKRPVRFIV
ncbi:hypothetical protein LMH73_022985, partial [Vibrio splendidus]